MQYTVHVHLYKCVFEQVLTLIGTKILSYEPNKPSKRHKTLAKVADKDKKSSSNC